jgi:four helix bundle protein
METMIFYKNLHIQNIFSHQHIKITFQTHVSKMKYSHQLFGENLIMNLSFNFALAIVDLAEELDKKKKFVISQQILKSGTSIGANIREAQAPESRPDFVHKMKIAAKEAEETEYWLLICQYAEHYPQTDDLLEELKVIKRVLSKIIVSSKTNK